MITSTDAVDTIIFDFDGVLADLDPIAAQEHFQGLLPLDLRELLSRWEVWLRCNEAAPDLVGFWWQLCSELHLPRSTFDALAGTDFGRMYHVFDDSKPTLDAVRARGFRTAILSNNPIAHLEGALRTLDLAARIDVALTPAMLGAAKPSPAAYVKALDALGRASSRCIFLDDELRNVEAATAANMRAFHVQRNAASTGAAVLNTLTSLTDALDLLLHERRTSAL